MLGTPTVGADDIAWIDEAGMREIDRIMVDELGIVLMQMMENAGRLLAETVRGVVPVGGRIVVVAGPGGNGGGGLAAARHLRNAGREVLVVLVADRERLGEVPAHQLGILDRMGVQVDPYGSDAAEAIERADAVVDAMVGYSLRGALRGAAASASRTINRSAASVVSLDVPSGVAADGGTHAVDVVRADITVTLCLPKIGLRGAAEVGRLIVADISVPPDVVRSVVDGAPPPFHLAPLIEVV